MGLASRFWFGDEFMSFSFLFLCVVDESDEQYDDLPSFAFYLLKSTVT